MNDIDETSNPENREFHTLSSQVIRDGEIHRYLIRNRTFSEPIKTRYYNLIKYFWETFANYDNESLEFRKNFIDSTISLYKNEVEFQEKYCRENIENRNIAITPIFMFISFLESRRDELETSDKIAAAHKIIKPNTNLNEFRKVLKNGAGTLDFGKYTVPEYYLFLRALNLEKYSTSIDYLHKGKTLKITEISRVITSYDVPGLKQTKRKGQQNTKFNEIFLSEIYQPLMALNFNS